jgi:HD-GYP domain-containing protein (c-di-GMP phosphodiesterase class II)
VILCLLLILFLRHRRTQLTERENERLVALARRSESDLAAQYRASLVALGTALEARDGYTGRHGEETVALAGRVAKRLNLSPERIVEVETVALLHDVGKIGTPNEILRKDAPLDEDEWIVMREHPLIGERILRTVPGLEKVALAVRHEHEHWDGSGYPDALAGDAIPLPSRIVLVCDAYHAMTSDRPYRMAMAPEDAVEELRRCAGIQFDPDVVDALLDDLETSPPEPEPAPVIAHQAAS